uniref:MIP18 family-like domain-containing protein n=1 Tax=Zooxanthella nutricula TaxID=1333877 RepID=A0A6U6J388_9DINO|mmetsp:Transcript_21812/g.64984  ORF Transcript_21812/g.64984 Transcript_21812/m.64984 type:complete len:174 (+) Transcript_21812:107-628(+)
MAEDNPNPVVYRAEAGAVALAHRSLQQLLEPDDWDDAEGWDELTGAEVYESLRYLSDPEHPNLSLEQLKVVQAGHVWVDARRVFVRFTPTVPTCSVATLIGLTIKAKLQRSLPRKYKVDVEIFPGSHDQEGQVNKQLADKERVAAALENPALRSLINNGIAGTDRPDASLLLA